MLFLDCTTLYFWNVNLSSRFYVPFVYGASWCRPTGHLRNQLRIKHSWHYFAILIVSQCFKKRVFWGYAGECQTLQDQSLKLRHFISILCCHQVFQKNLFIQFITPPIWPFKLWSSFQRKWPTKFTWSFSRCE